jgi:hypothetical protein
METIIFVIYSHRGYQYYYNCALGVKLIAVGS